MPGKVTTEIPFAPGIVTVVDLEQIVNQVPGAEKLLINMDGNPHEITIHPQDVGDISRVTAKEIAEVINRQLPMGAVAQVAPGGGISIGGTAEVLHQEDHAEHADHANVATNDVLSELVVGGARFSPKFAYYRGSPTTQEPPAQHVVAFRCAECGEIKREVRFTRLQAKQLRSMLALGGYQCEECIAGDVRAKAGARRAQARRRAKAEGRRRRARRRR